LDAGGLALQIDEGNGVKIPAVSQQQAVDAIAAALENLANNPALLLQYGRASRLRVSEEFNWARKAREVRAIYDRLLASNPIVAPGAVELQSLGNKPEVPAYRGDSF
jgi:glycosyltransferase involved in cell wall biosynthesis